METPGHRVEVNKKILNNNNKERLFFKKKTHNIFELHMTDIKRFFKKKLLEE